MPELHVGMLKAAKDLFQKRVECDTLIKNSTLQNATEQEGWCPIVFDGFTCWPATKAGEVAHERCPTQVVGWDSRRFAFKECLENGTWFRHPQPPYKEWSNYTTCVNFEDLSFRQLVNRLYIIGYSLSLAAIIISLIIFLSFRTLKCTRIRIHIHLFISFALNNIMWLIWYRHVIPDTDVLKENPVWCEALHILIHYFMVANYLWMFCEGLHLHLALVVVFVRDELAMKWFTILGWVISAILVTIYAVVRSTIPADRDQCWVQDSDTTWILTIPVLISLIASTVFLINVVRVLLTKLHPCSAQPAPLAMRKAVRATLILVPLFGLHLVFTPYRPAPYSPVEYTYEIVAAMFVSLQGFCVACLFCFANHDVLQTLRVRLRRLCPDSLDRTRTTGADSLGIVANGNTQSKDVVV